MKTIVNPNQGGTGVNNNAASLVTVSGNFPLTITITGNTALTLPVSGTVATTAGNVATATALATGRTIAITGDLTYTSPSFDGTTNVTAAGVLATVNNNVGSFTNANITVNAKGLITAASNGSGGGGSIGGSTGVNDNRLLRSDGTGGSTLQASSVIVTDSGNISTAGFITTNSISTDNYGWSQLDGAGSFYLTLGCSENLTGNRSLAVILNDVNRTVNLSGNIVTAGNFTTSGANALTLTTTGATNVTLPTSGTLVSSASGSNTYVQYNNSNAFAGSPDFTWDNTNKIFAVGDVGEAINATTLYLDDDAQEIDIQSSGQVNLGDLNSAGNDTVLLINDPNERIRIQAIHVNIPAIAVYANNAAAISGGLVLGDLYYTNVAGDGVVKVVI